MVRFIISIPGDTAADKQKIYIPIWLDLLYTEVIQNGEVNNNLHSNMVRFIMSDISNI